jgi:hypothetical protein
VHANEFILGVAIHLAKSRIDLNETPVQILDKQAIVGGLKDAAIEGFSLTQLLLGLHLLSDITRRRKNMGLPFVEKRGEVGLEMEGCPIFPQSDSLGVKLPSRLKPLKSLLHKIVIIGVNGNARKHANHFLIRVAMHPTLCRIDLNYASIFQINNGQSVGGGFKDAAILLFSLA